MELPHADSQTHNTLPLLHQIRHALQHLLDTGEPTIIDLRAMPLSTSEEAELESRLGLGEVECTLNALGKSTIRETAVAGVWLVSHYNQSDELMAKSIEVTTIPTILPSDREAMSGGVEAITHLLEQQDQESPHVQ